jgi:hypothetical protein
MPLPPDGGALPLSDETVRITSLTITPRVATGIAGRVQKIRELQYEITLMIDVLADGKIPDGATFTHVDTDLHRLMFAVPLGENRA